MVTIPDTQVTHCSAKWAFTCAENQHFWGVTDPHLIFVGLKSEAILQKHLISLSFWHEERPQFMLPLLPWWLSRAKAADRNEVATITLCKWLVLILKWAELLLFAFLQKWTGQKHWVFPSFPSRMKPLTITSFFSCLSSQERPFALWIRPYRMERKNHERSDWAWDLLPASVALTASRRCPTSECCLPKVNCCAGGSLETQMSRELKQRSNLDVDTT